MHSFNMLRGSRKELYDFETKMLMREYRTFKNNHPDMFVQCNFRNVNFYSILVPVKFDKAFLTDLAPYNTFGVDGGAGLKNNLLKSFDLLRGQFGLKRPLDSLSKRKVINPNWRDNLVVFLIGYKEIDKMKKYVLAVEGQRKFTNHLIEYFEKVKYTTQLPNKPGLRMPLIVNEIRFFDVSVFESSMGQLLNDLSPFTSLDYHLNPIIKFGLNISRKIFGLKSPPVKMEANVSKVPNRDKVQIYMLGLKDDARIVDNDYSIIEAEMI